MTKHEEVSKVCALAACGNHHKLPAVSLVRKLPTCVTFASKCTYQALGSSQLCAAETKRRTPGQVVLECRLWPTASAPGSPLSFYNWRGAGACACRKGCSSRPWQLPILGGRAGPGGSSTCCQRPSSRCFFLANVPLQHADTRTARCSLCSSECKHVLKSLLFCFVVVTWHLITFILASRWACDPLATELSNSERGEVDRPW